MNCADAKKNMVEHLLGEMAPEESADLRRHLRECASCNEEFTRLRAGWERISGLPLLQPTPGCIGRVESAIDAIAPPDRAAKRMRVLVPVFGALAAASILLAVGLMFMRPPKPAPVNVPVPAPRQPIVAPAQAAEIPWDTSFDDECAALGEDIRSLASTSTHSSEHGLGFADTTGMSEWDAMAKPSNHIDSSIERLKHDIEEIGTEINDESAQPPENKGSRGKSAPSGTCFAGCADELI
jgi:hypothetical protein